MLSVLRTVFEPRMPKRAEGGEAMFLAGAAGVAIVP